MQATQYAKIITTIAIIALVGGCTPATIEERIIDACIEDLEDTVDQYSKYDGAEFGSIKGSLIALEPLSHMNEKYNTDQFKGFNVYITEFTIKNGFGTNVRASSVCGGYFGSSDEIIATSQLINGQFWDYRNKSPLSYEEEYVAKKKAKLVQQERDKLKAIEDVMTAESYAAHCQVAREMIDQYGKYAINKTELFSNLNMLKAIGTITGEKYASMYKSARQCVAY